MRQVLTIARLTILEASRRKLLLALGVLTVVVIVVTSWGFSRLPTMNGVTPAEVRLASSQLTILVAFMFSGVLALGSTLVAAPSIASDIESGIALAILPRPIRRSQLLMGKWLGLAVLVGVYAAGSGLLELLGIWLATGYTPPNPVAALTFVAAEGIVLMTLALLLSTRLAPMTGGVIALVLFFVAWIGGIALAIGQTFANDTKPPMVRTWNAPTPAQHVILRAKRELEQVHLCLGSRGFPQQGDERYAAALFNAILGGGMSSRLFQKIREKEGLVYTVMSYHNGYVNGGYEAIYAACAPKNLKRVLDMTLAEMRLIKSGVATAEELSSAKLHLKGSILLSLESTVSRMSGLARQEYYFGRQFSPDEIIAAIDAVTLEDIAHVAATIVDPEGTAWPAWRRSSARSTASKVRRKSRARICATARPDSLARWWRW